MVWRADALEGLGVAGVFLGGGDRPEDLDGVLTVEEFANAPDEGAMFFEARELLGQALLGNAELLAIAIGDDKNKPLLSIQPDGYQVHANALNGRFLGPDESDAAIETCRLSFAQKPKPVLLGQIESLEARLANIFGLAQGNGPAVARPEYAVVGVAESFGEGSVHGAGEPIMSDRRLGQDLRKP